MGPRIFFYRLFIFPLLSLSIVSCATGGISTLSLNYQPVTDTECQLSAIPTRKIKLVRFVDKRDQNVESIMIGSRQAAFGVSMGEVYSESPIFEVVKDAIETELTRCGHSVVNDNEDVVIGGEIKDFWVGTDVTALYWDVHGEVSIVLDIKKWGDDNAIQMGPYGGKKVERTYSNPSAEIMTRVLKTSLSDTVQAITSDAEFSDALK